MKQNIDEKSKEVILTKHGHVALITLNKPESLNALCEDFMAQIDAALNKVTDDQQIYALIITGTGKAFVAGADIDEMYPMDSQLAFRWSALGSKLNLKVESMAIPVIAAINGYALGGGLELAMACDIRLADHNAKMGLPETSLGVICGAGGTQRLPRIVGEAFAKEIIYTGKVLDAQEAFNAGLVNHLYPASDLLDEAFALAESIGKNGPLAVKAAKKAIAFSKDSGIVKGCLYERDLFSGLFDTEDQKTGMGAFVNKEKNVNFNNR